MPAKSPAPLRQLHRPVIIAMIAVRMVQVAIDKIIDVVAVRHLWMSAVRAVGVRAVDLRRAFCGIGRVDRDHMFIDVIAVHMMQMAVMKIVDMIVMANCGVSATRAVLMGVVGVVFLVACGHWKYSLRALSSRIDVLLIPSPIK
jgi:hypothetical protein